VTRRPEDERVRGGAAVTLVQRKVAELGIEEAWSSSAVKHGMDSKGDRLGLSKAERTVLGVQRGKYSGKRESVVREDSGHDIGY